VACPGPRKSGGKAHAAPRFLYPWGSLESKHRDVFDYPEEKWFVQVARIA